MIGSGKVLLLFADNTCVLRTSDPIGEHLAKVAEQNILHMLCGQCAFQLALADGNSGNCRPVGTVAAARLGAPRISTPPSPATRPIR